jgi:LuxR family transcriptional regulator, maltose regulon positive regulatory protein
MSVVPPLLTTKLSPPPARPGLVPRPRLIGRLSQGLRRKLTLLSAPAGFGKTTLLVAWLHQLQIADEAQPNLQSTIYNLQSSRVAWVSLDDGDNEPARFWRYFLAAFEGLQDGIGQAALALLRSTQPAPIESVLTALINDLARLSTEGALILDDYHIIQAPSIHRGVALLLDRLPAHLHLVLASRATPPLPLARLRARDQLIEITANDLRFSADETTLFLQQTMGLAISADRVAALEMRTEGWIAGLQLAALSLHNRDDVDDFITTFTGGQRYILDYLTEEVFDRQPPHIQSFLLQTSILDRLSGPLCDAVLEREIRDWRLEIAQSPISNFQSQAILEHLERANLFIVPLDQERRWYRYHQLFAEFLRSRLRTTYAERLPELHRRAALWHERNGLIAEAIDHALAAADHAWAARLVEEHAERMLTSGEGSAVRGWLAALPAALVRVRPRLSVAYAWAMLAASNFAEAEPYLRDAEAALASSTSAQSAEREELAVLIDAARATVAINVGDYATAVELSRRALERLPETNLLLLGQTALNLGDAYATEELFDTAAAQQAFAKAIAAGKAGGYADVVVVALGSLGQLHGRMGQLRQAAATYQEALHYAAQQGRPVFGAGKAHVYLSGVLLEWEDQGAAATHLTQGIELCKQWGHLQHVLDGYHYLAQLQLAQGNLGAALETIEYAQQLAASALRTASGADQSLRNKKIGWAAERIAVTRARLWLAEGNLDAVGRWVQERKLAVDGDMSRHRDGHAILARLLIAQGKPGEALVVLEQLLRSYESAGWMWGAISTMTLQALAFQAQGSLPAALDTLRRALALAAPEGYLHTFVEKGEPMAALLGEARAQSIAPPYITKLLAAFNELSIEHAVSSMTPRKASNAQFEALSERELRVLRLLAAGLSNQEIASELVVSVNTVKTHIKRIYDKLGVHSRVTAIEQARQLQLL